MVCIFFICGRSKLELWQAFGMNERVAYIRTSDRGSWRGCRRRWGWESGLRGNMRPKGTVGYLWLGTAYHYFLEDYHGYHYHETPTQALEAFTKAWKKTRGYTLPDDWKEQLELGIQMADYYPLWLENRFDFKTLYEVGVPQCEVRFNIDIPFDTPHYDRVVYQGTIDRMAEDEFGHLWIVEYKTAAQFEDRHFLTDPQVTAYCWAASVLYGRPIEGVIYQQHHKSVPGLPRILSGGRISADKSQRTTRKLYRDALINLYTSVEKAPANNVDTLNELASMETEDRDRFIRRDRIERNLYQIEAEGEKLMLELEEMLDPDTPLYPMPNRFCGSCAFLSPCVSIDDGSDWQAELKDTMQPREKEYDKWRQHLQLPEQSNPIYRDANL